MSGQIKRLVGLYPLLEMRLPLNTVVHLLNPLGASLSLLGVAKQSHRELHRETAKLLDMYEACCSLLGRTASSCRNPPWSSPKY